MVGKRALISNCLASSFFTALCFCAASLARDFFGNFTFLYLPTCDLNYLRIFILGLVFFSIIFQCALYFSKEVSFIPYHTPLNLTVRSKNVPNKPPTQFAYFILYILYTVSFSYHIVFTTLPAIHTLDQLLINLLVFTIQSARLSPTLGKKIIITMRNFLIYQFLALSLIPCEWSALWIFCLLLLSGDIHPNPGPLLEDEFSTGFLSFCNWNLNSLATDNFKRITLLTAENTIHKYDIISLCETSLNSETVVPENAIPGYIFHPLNHPSGGRHGGVGIFYKETLPLRVRPDLSFDECLVSELRFGRKKIFFTVIYRNPCHKASSPEFELFLSNFENLHKRVKLENPYVSFFAGDLNGHSKSWYEDGDTNAEGAALNSLFTELDLDQIISEPTHFFNDHSNPSCIDVIVTDQPNLVLDSGVRPSLDPLVHHQMTFCKLNFKIPPPPKYDRKLWHFKKAQTNLIKTAIKSFPWERRLGNLNDPSDQVNLLNETILNIMSNFVPNEIKRYRPSEPAWFNHDIRYRLKKQNKLYRKYRYKGYLNHDKKVLEEYKAETATFIENAKENYLKRQGIRLADQSSSQKTYWKIMNEFLNRTKIPRIPPIFHNGNFIVNSKDKAQVFNHYFAEQCTPFDTPSTLPSLNYLTADRLSHFDIDIKEIKDLIKVIKINKAHGHDDISVQMIKLCGDDICLPLLLIFKNILHTGLYPNQWKLANVTPVHKKKDKQTVGNYRPISLLPIFDKIFERIVFKNLYNYLLKNNLISPHQSGFRPGDSCGNQLLSLTNEIHKAFHDKKCLEVRAIFLDMSKAFDKVWHEGLLFKLKQNGINGKLLDLFTDYLSNRKQRVVLNGMNSEWSPLLSGVPQGSVLGPLLFLIYVNDLENGIKSKIKFFADDTSLFSVIHDPIISASELNHDLQLIHKWAQQWKMSFNPDPTKPAEEILFSVKRNSPLHPPIYYNGIEVKRVPTHKHLGLIFDPKLSFTSHVDEISATARKGIGLIKHLRPYLPVNSLEQIYKMRIRSHFDYCDYIFHTPALINNSSTDINLNYVMDSLESLQYQAATAVTGTWKGTNRDKIYDQLGWESLHNRREFRRITQFYKIMNNLTPKYLAEPIPNPHSHLFGPRSTNVIPPIYCRNDRYKCSFYPDAIDKWNNIGVEIRSIEKISDFKASIVDIIRPPKKDIFNVHNPDGSKLIFQLRVGLSPLRAHKVAHNFQDTPSNICLCGTGIEDTAHFLIVCPFFANKRNKLFTEITAVHQDFENLSTTEKVNALLYGINGLNDIQNTNILNATIVFLLESGRFDRETPI